MKALIPRLCIAMLFMGSLVAQAADGPAAKVSKVNLDVTEAATPVTDVLATLSRQSGARIIADSTVVDTIGAARIATTTLDDALTSLTQLDPGLTWNKITLSADAVVPNADDLSAALRALRKIKSDDISVSGNSADSSMSVHKEATVTSADDHKVVVYLVTNETVWDRKQDEKVNAHYRQGGAEAVENTMTNLRLIANTFDQMTPDQQSQIMPVIWSQLRYITRNISPEVLNRFEHMPAQQ